LREPRFEPLGGLRLTQPVRKRDGAVQRLRAVASDEDVASYMRL
jgi:hypothetical protein